MTLHDQYVAALQSVHGAQFVRQTGRYTVLTRYRTKDGRPTFWFVGRNGAIRYGCSVSASFSMHDNAKMTLLLRAAAGRNE